MQVSILACVLSAVAAICLYASAAHVFAARHPWFRGVHLIFAVIAATAAVHAIAHMAMFNAADETSYLRALRYSNLSGVVVMALLPWLIQGYFGGGGRLAPSLLTAFYVLSGALDELARHFSSNPSIQIERIVLPWGESIAIHRLDTAPFALMLFWLVTAFLLGFITILAIKRGRRNRRQTIAMAVAMTALVLALGGNVLVLADRLDFIFMGEFGFLALSLTMMRLLSGEESYRMIVSQALAGIFVVAPSGRLLEVNGTGRKMLGFSRAEFLSLSIADLLQHVQASE